MRREEGSGIPPEHGVVGGEPSEAEEVLSYWFPEGLASADLETLRRHGQRWMHGGPEVDREITKNSAMYWSGPDAESSTIGPRRRLVHANT